MSLRILTCPVCLNIYDRREHLPKVIISCGHTLCQECLTAILRVPNNARCPIDNIVFPKANKTIDKFQPNYIVVELIEEMSGDEICTEHQEKISLICFTDKSRICHECILFGDHKGHNVEPLKKIKLDLETKKQILETVLKDADQHYANANETIDGAMVSIERTIKRRFKEFKQFLKNKEQEMLHEAKCFFDHHKKQARAAFGASSKLRQEISDQLSGYKNNTLSQGLFFLIDDDIRAITAKVNNEVLAPITADLEKELTSAVDGLNSLLKTKIRPPYDLRLPMQEMSDAMTKFFSTCHDTEFKFEPYSEFKIHTSLKIRIKDDVLTFSPNENGAEEIGIQPEVFREITTIVFVINDLALSSKDTTVITYILQFIEKPKSLEIICNSGNALNTVLNSVLLTISPISANLQSFEVGFEKCQNISDGSILLLMEGTIPNMKNLQSLTIWLFGTYISDDSILALTKYNSEILSSLSSLKINLGDTEVTDASVATLFFEMPLLTNFYLNLKGTQVTDASINALVERAMPAMVCIQSFELYVSRTRITEQSISFPFELSRLARFGLGLGGLEVSQNFWIRLKENYLEKMTSLEHLSLTVFDQKVGDEEISYVLNALKPLKTFSIGVFKTEITDKMLEDLMKGLKSSEESLRKLDLGINYTKLTDEGLLKLLEFLKGLNRLEELAIDVSGTLVTNKFAEELLDGVLPAMERLYNFNIYAENTAISAELREALVAAQEEFERKLMMEE